MGRGILLWLFRSSNSDHHSSRSLPSLTDGGGGLSLVIVVVLVLVLLSKL